MPTPKVASKTKTRSAPKRAGCGLTFQVAVVVEPDGDEFYAYCPAIKGLHVGGATVAEAVKNARDAAIAFLEMMVEYGDPIPVGVQFDGDGKPRRERWPRKADAVHVETLLIHLK